MCSHFSESTLANENEVLKLKLQQLELRYKNLLMLRENLREENRDLKQFIAQSRE